MTHFGWNHTGGRRPPFARRPGPGQESVWDYPRPPRLEPVHGALRVMFGGITVASTRNGWRLCETASPPTYYFPPEDVRRECLAPSERRTFCEWKGHARYFHVRTDSRLVRNAAWCYEAPPAALAPIRNWLAFYPGLADACFVGAERVCAQAGDYYGGWITSDLVGPFKGEPGTEGW